MPCIDENSKELLFSCRWLLCNEGFILCDADAPCRRPGTYAFEQPLEAIVNETFVHVWRMDARTGIGASDYQTTSRPGNSL